MPKPSCPPYRRPIDTQATNGIDWARWTVVGCVAWLALVLILGGPAVAFILTPVAGPIGGWLLGLLVYLISGRTGRRNSRRAPVARHDRRR